MRIIKVSGNSMRPCYRSGDYLLVGRYGRCAPRAGDDVVFRHRDFGMLLKRVSRLEGDLLRVSGLDPLSADAAGLGTVGRAAWPRLERVLLRIPRPWRGGQR